MASHKLTIQELNTLLTRAHDAEHGYLEAADKVENEALASLFRHISQNRKAYGKTIKREIARLGGEPDKGTSLQADIHRTWMDIRASFAKGEEALLKECLRGEKTTLKNYEIILEGDNLPKPVQHLLQEQATQISVDLDRLTKLEKISA